MSLVQLMHQRSSKNVAMDPVSAAGMVLSASTIICDLVIDCLNLFEKLSSQNFNARVYFRVEAAENSYNRSC
jgi:hypothetical protein